VELLLAVIAVIALVIAVALVVRLLFGVVTVHEYERGLRFERGRFRGLVDAGTHVTFRPTGELRILDARPGFAVVEGQELLTSDGLPLKVSLVARFVVGDAVTANLVLQLGLREMVGRRTLDELLGSRAEIGPGIREMCSSDVSALGLELLVVEVRDLMVGGDLKRAYVSVAAARKEGEAALERARGETAALRSLANAGRLVEDNPALLQLRMLQQVGATPGSTIMVSLPDGTTGSDEVRAKAALRGRPTNGDGQSSGRR
jgi:regulator of protease activity HflC (stomatin/prohibitin superfamily)